MEGSVRDHMGLNSQAVRKLQLETHQIEQGSILFELNQKIEITTRSVLCTGPGPEHSGTHDAEVPKYGDNGLLKVFDGSSHVLKDTTLAAEFQPGSERKPSYLLTFPPPSAPAGAELT